MSIAFTSQMQPGTDFCGPMVFERILNIAYRTVLYIHGLTDIMLVLCIKHHKDLIRNSTEVKGELVDTKQQGCCN